MNNWIRSVIGATGGGRGLAAVGLGCRWYAPDCTVIPKKPTLRIKSLYWKRKPSFIFRSADMAQVAHSEWSAKVRLNGFTSSVGYSKYLAKATREDIIRETGIEPEHLEYARMWAKFQSDPRLDGSWIPGVGDESKTPWTPPVYAHTLEPRVPSQNIGEGLLTEADKTEHPEYFALVDGKRRPYKTVPGVQPCYTNPDLPMVVASRAKEWLKRNPKATYISVSQADTDIGCECDSCKALTSTFTYAQNRMSDGKLTIAPLDLSVSDGRLRRAPQVFLVPPAAAAAGLSRHDQVQAGHKFLLACSFQRRVLVVVTQNSHDPLRREVSVLLLE